MQNKTNQPTPIVRILAHSTLALSLILFGLVSRPTFALDILIGSSQTDTFNHHVGRALCRLINDRADDLDCDVLPAEADLHSSDYVHTLTNVRNGALDLGIVDSSIQYDVVNRSGQFEYFDISFDNLRSLFSLNGIPFTVVVRGDERLETLTDLKGKKVNVGNPGSSQRAIMDSLMRSNDWKKKDFLLMEELPAAQSQDTLALCFGTVDAVIRFDVHPNAATKHMVDLCDARLLSVAGAAVNKLMSDSPFYSALSIPADTYTSNSKAVDTFGLLETVITTEDLDEETAYVLVKSVFEQLDRLRASHAAFSTLTPVDMYSDGLSVPLHPGALRYFREQGWTP